MYQLIDFINPSGTYGLTEQLEKIRLNIAQLEVFKQNIEHQKKISRNAFSCMSVFGRWIIIYQANVESNDNTLMHFIDFRLDIDSLPQGVFSSNAVNGIKQIQSQYDSVFSPKIDTVELMIAEVYETVLKPNLFTCNMDEKVLNRAKELGVLPMVETMKEGDFVKVTVVDEKVKMHEREITNLYAIFRFAGHSVEEEHKNGFMYLKLYDLINNLNLLDDFEMLIKKAGGQFTRSILMERFISETLN